MLQFAANPSSVGRSFSGSPLSRVYAPLATRAVGHDEQSLASVAGADLGRAEYSARNAVAHAFQWPDESGELPVRIPRHVLAEETSRPALVDDAEQLVDEPAVVVLPASPSGDAVGLAGVARSDAINDATPRSSVERSCVRPDRSLMKPSRRHACDQACGRRGFPLHVHDSAASGFGNPDAELESADTGAEGQNSGGT